MADENKESAEDMLAALWAKADEYREYKHGSMTMDMAISIDARQLERLYGNNGNGTENERISARIEHLRTLAPALPEGMRADYDHFLSRLENALTVAKAPPAPPRPVRQPPRIQTLIGRARAALGRIAAEIRKSRGAESSEENRESLKPKDNPDDAFYKWLSDLSAFADRLKQEELPEPALPVREAMADVILQQAEQMKRIINVRPPDALMLDASAKVLLLLLSRMPDAIKPEYQALAEQMGKLIPKLPTPADMETVRGKVSSARIDIETGLQMIDSVTDTFKSPNLQKAVERTLSQIRSALQEADRLTPPISSVWPQNAEWWTEALNCCGEVERMPGAFSLGLEKIKGALKQYRGTTTERQTTWVQRVGDDHHVLLNTLNQVAAKTHDARFMGRVLRASGELMEKFEGTDEFVLPAVERTWHVLYNCRWGLQDLLNTHKNLTQADFEQYEHTLKELAPQLRKRFNFPAPFAIPPNRYSGEYYAVAGSLKDWQSDTLLRGLHASTAAVVKVLKPPFPLSSPA